MRNFIRQLIALASLCLLATATPAQFQNLYYYQIVGGGNFTGIYKDVQCLENQPANMPSIITVGSDNQVPPSGVMAYHDVAGNPLNILRFAIAGTTVDGMAICNSPAGNVIACFFDPVNRATEVVSTNNTGTVINWQTRIPNFMGRDLVSANMGIAGNGTVWITGNTIPNGANPNAAVVSLTEAFGVLNWYKEYDLQPANYGTTIGHEIAFSNGAFQWLYVAGRADVIGCRAGVLGMRINANTGVANWVKVYKDPACGYDLIGKTIVKAPAGPNWAIGMEYRNAAGNMIPAMMEITNVGGWVNSFAYPGGGFFNSNAFGVEGLDTDGQNYLLSGSFTNGRPFGYTLNVNAALAGVQYNEYETGGLFNPPSATSIVDLDYSATMNRYLIGGNFRPTAGDPNWPIWPVPAGFWLISGNGNGATPCTHLYNPQSNQVVPEVPEPVWNENTFPIAQPQLAPTNPNLFMFPQCNGGPGGGGNGKSDMLSDIQAEAIQPTFTYTDASQQIIARVPADIQGSMSLSLIDMQGRILTQVSLTAGEHRIDASQLSTGIYFLRFEAAGLNAGTQKVLVR